MSRSTSFSLVVKRSSWVSTSRRLLRSWRDRVRHRARVAHDGHVLLVVDQRGQAFGHHLVVLDYENSRGVAPHSHIYTLDSESGSQNSTVVPSPGSLVILFQPPARSARAFRASSPRLP